MRCESPRFRYSTRSKSINPKARDANHSRTSAQMAHSIDTNIHIYIHRYRYHATHFRLQRVVKGFRLSGYRSLVPGLQVFHERQSLQKTPLSLDLILGPHAIQRVNGEDGEIWVVPSFQGRQGRYRVHPGGTSTGDGFAHCADKASRMERVQIAPSTWVRKLKLTTHTKNFLFVCLLFHHSHRGVFLGVKLGASLMGRLSPDQNEVEQTMSRPPSVAQCSCAKREGKWRYWRQVPRFMIRFSQEHMRFLSRTCHPNVSVCIPPNA